MVKTHTTYQLRGYCTKNGYQRIRQALNNCAELYNAALQERRDAWKSCRHCVSLYDQMKEFTGVRQDLLKWRKLDILAEAFYVVWIDRLTIGGLSLQTPGYPRFKSRYKYVTLETAQVRPEMIKISPDNKHIDVRIKGLPIITLN